MDDTQTPILNKIKTRGYWEIHIRPDSFPQEKIPLPKLRDIIDECQVKQRGWYFPVIDRRHGETSFGDNYLTSDVQWNEFLEIWRFYQSGQFICYMGLLDDRLKDNDNVESFKSLDIIWSLYTITEFFIFAKNLVSKKIMGDNVQINIKLHDTENRILTINEPMRHLHQDYTCKIKELTVFEGTIPVTKLLADYDKIALDTTMAVFHKFGWLNKDMESVLKNDQEKLLKGFF